MGKVTFNMSVSLDGFVAGPKDEVDQLFGWYFSGEKEIPVQEGRFVLKVSPESAKILEESQQTIGAMVASKRMFDCLGIEPVQLESTRVIPTPHVTHLQFRVVQQR